MGGGVGPAEKDGYEGVVVSGLVEARVVGPGVPGVK